MNIYAPRVLTERTIQNFIPARLAIKELAGKLYFCKSTRIDIENYPGSGKKWKDRIKKYGRQNIKTLWISDWYHDPYEIQEVALHFSKENNIVESDRWANIRPENGLDGGDTSKTPNYQSKKHLFGRPGGTISPNQKKTLSESKSKWWQEADKTNYVHGTSKRVITPNGIFDTMNAACKSHGVVRSTMRIWIHTKEGFDFYPR
jgi:hypothetical protein